MFLEKLTWIFVWIDWNLYAYWLSLISFVSFFIWHQMIFNNKYSLGGLDISALMLSIFIGFCAWNVYCALRYGYAVG